MEKVTINREVCKGCLLCVHACPKKVLEQKTQQPNQKGYYPVRVVRPKDCIACGLCGLMCPDCAIKVEKE